MTASHASAGAWSATSRGSTRAVPAPAGGGSSTSTSRPHSQPLSSTAAGTVALRESLRSMPRSSSAGTSWTRACRSLGRRRPAWHTRARRCSAGSSRRRSPPSSGSWTPRATTSRPRCSSSRSARCSAARGRRPPGPPRRALCSSRPACRCRESGWSTGRGSRSWTAGRPPASPTCSAGCGSIPTSVRTSRRRCRSPA